MSKTQETLKSYLLKASFVPDPECRPVVTLDVAIETLQQLYENYTDACTERDMSEALSKEQDAQIKALITDFQRMEATVRLGKAMLFGMEHDDIDAFEASVAQLEADGYLGALDETEETL